MSGDYTFFIVIACNVHIYKKKGDQLFADHFHAVQDEIKGNLYRFTKKWNWKWIF